MKPGTRVSLSTMMFLEFFIWGSWFVTMGTYLSKTLKASDVQNGLAYGTQSLGAIIAPFIVGLIADRFFAAQRILGLLHFAGAALMYFLSRQTDFDSFYPLILTYMILYMPTLALVNSVSFRQLTNPEKEFATLRVWGTIGWIVAGLFISFATDWEKNNALANTFRMAAVASLLLGILSFFLPNTPPASKGKRVSFGDIIGLDALSLLKKKDFLIFFLSAMLICIPLAFYYQEANKYLNEINLANAAGKMTLGQVSETLFMILMPLFFRRFGIKVMLLIGMIAWVVRYLLFSYGDVTGIELSFLYLGILLHGICYDFFFVTGQIYTDKQAGERIQSAAQGLITLATYGVGMLIGFWVAGQVSEHFRTADGHNWKSIWMVPAAIAGIVVLLFAILFKENPKTTEKAEPVAYV
ncbi:nucleoside permease [Chitinophagaceae bacterium LB-8]|uniref:Nucleoside permease n=1 Tax=Paraflavisolibacter caeni TaxID=2982496 RepID=A0A9X2XXX6_9BACT|nr:nucleoside permease [Paraflavisolibacter caeni]MCU7551441.1 nucleoside permease [Paraflavisolibacter caeni]